MRARPSIIAQTLNVLKQTCAAALLALCACAVAARAQTPPMPDSVDNPIVVECRSEQVLIGATVRPNIVSDMVAWGLTALTDQPTTHDAWAGLIDVDAVVGIKLEPFGAETINTTPVLLDTIVRSLNAAGVETERIVLIDPPRIICDPAYGSRAGFGWSSEAFDAGRGDEYFLRAYEDVDVIINIAYLKHDNLTGLRAGIRNVTLGGVRHRDRYFANGGDPELALILARPILRRKLKLTIIDALRIVYRDGPVATETNLHNVGTLIFSRDPVAADAVALDVLNQARSDRNLPPVGGVNQISPVLITAGRLGLGMPLIENIDHRVQWF